MSIRTCRTCGEPQPASAFATPHAKRCARCTEQNQPRTHRCCYTCGEDVPVQGFSHGTAKACDACKALSDDRRHCATCGELKRPGQFASGKARACSTCKRRLARAKCERCGDIAGPARKSGARRYCNACLPSVLADLARTSAAERSARAAARTAKRCPGCMEVKKLTAEHWSPGARNGTPGRWWDSHCKACRAAVAADRLASDAAYRASQVERQRRAYAAERARREADAEYDAMVRERHREWDRAYRARKREGLPSPRAHTRPRGGSRFAMLPGRPLAAAIRSTAARAGDGDLLAYCELIGVPDRNIRAWENDRAEVTIDVADRALTHMGLLWFDVWEPGTPDGDAAQAAFEGESAVAA